jgi:TRAP-type C4-dicarboxylate transport system substrate-binding protein
MALGDEGIRSIKNNNLEIKRPEGLKNKTLRVDPERQGELKKKGGERATARLD